MFDKIDNGRSWSDAVARMCDNLKIPDLTTRHALKRAHARFDDIYQRLDAMYSSAGRRGDEKAMGAVVGLMAKMCTDAILRDRLFQKDPSDTPYRPSSSCIGYSPWRTATRKDIVRYNGVLVKIMQRHPDDAKVAEMVIFTVSHATEAVVTCEATPEPGLLRTAAIPSTLEAKLTAFHIRTSSPVMYAYAFVAAPTQHCPEDCKADLPFLLNFLAAMTRGRNITARAVAFFGILRLPVAESEFDRSQFDSRRALAVYQRGMHQHLSGTLRNYGLGSRSLRSRSALPKVADLIQRTEIAIVEGGRQVEGPDGSWSCAIESDTPGFLFTRLTDALPRGKAMRSKGTLVDLDAADVIDMKFYMTRGRLPEAIAFGSRPRICILNRLKCKNISPFMRSRMLWRAVGHAAQRGLAILRHAAEWYTQARVEGTAYLMSAWEDAKTYVTEAPPDGRLMLEVLSWYALLTILVRGDELSEDLRELDPARRMVNTAKECMDDLGYPIM
ncbi:hypothetical protein BN946_scf184702.g3 [Trametes cinnabarina]|uniref:Uncharacterized protein n=1 Tax=Pycnoporus cinnabarinus TaxID=5643 RepID=A0A060SU55_PYCCI|nr:hypothetical protein BN946_scf184702.g3 [Trametes cinnabarina]